MKNLFAVFVSTLALYSTFAWGPAEQNGAVKLLALVAHNIKQTNLALKNAKTEYVTGEKMGFFTQQFNINNYSFPNGAQSTDFGACSLPYGARVSVPFGEFVGDDLVALKTIEQQSTQLVKGNGGWRFSPESRLVETDSLVGAELVPAQNPISGQPGQMDLVCKRVRRYRYLNMVSSLEFTALPTEAMCTYRLVNQNNQEACLWDVPERAVCNTNRPTRFISTGGHSILEINSAAGEAVIRTPGGGLEVLKKHTSSNLQSVKVFELLGSGFFQSAPRYMELGDQYRSHSSTSSQGLVTKFDYHTGACEEVKSITDALGRKTEYTYNADCNLASVSVPGLGSSRLTTSYEWQDLSWKPEEVMPGVKRCDIAANTNVPNLSCSGALTTKVLTKVTTPDGRFLTLSYVFGDEDPERQGKNSWGAVTRVISSTGAQTIYRYGNKTASTNTVSFRPPGMQSCGPSNYDNLVKYRMTHTTVRDSSGQNSFTTQYVHDTVTPVAFSYGLGSQKAQWIKTINPDGSSLRTALLLNGNVTGTVVASETYAPNGRLVSRKLLGDLNTGTLFATYKTFVDGTVVDFLPTKTITESYEINSPDGSAPVVAVEELTYDTVQDPIAPGRALGNVISTKGFVDGQLVAETKTSYLYSADYFARNILGLPKASVVKGLGGQIVSASTIEYDNFNDSPIQPSNMVGLVPVGNVRGWPTATTTYLVPADVVAGQPGAGAHTARVEYYDTGDVYRSFDAVNSGSKAVASVVNYPDFSLCDNQGQVKSVLVSKSISGLGLSGDAAAEAPGYETQVYTDCNTGAALATVGINGELSCMMYDGMGRVLEVAGPGDALSGDIGNKLPQGIPGRYAYYLPAQEGFPNCLGSQGPTAWTDYPTAGQMGPDRIVSHTKDKTADGFVTRSFSDELGRVYQTCSESVDVTKDPVIIGVSTDENGQVVQGSSLSEAGEFCSNTFFDAQGRAFASTSAFFRLPPFESPATVPSDVQVARSVFDAISRVVHSYTTTLEEVYNPSVSKRIVELGETRTEYSQETRNGARFFVVKVTDGEGNSSKTYSDVLGRTVEVKSPTSIDASGCTERTPPRGSNSRPVLECKPQIRCGPDSQDGKLYCSTSFEYDFANRLISITDAHFNVTKFAYDGFGRKVWMKDPDVGETLYNYGLRGLLSSSDWKLNDSADGLSVSSYLRTTRYGYDVLGRMVVLDTPVETNGQWVQGPDDDDQITYYDEYSEGQCFECDFSQSFCKRTTSSCDDGTHFGL